MTGDDAATEGGVIKLAFDTNVWSLVAENDQAEEVAAGIEARGWRIALPPATMDEQQAAYLVDCDVYVTADHVFALILQELSRKAPVALARVAEVPRVTPSARTAIVDSVIAVLSAKDFVRRAANQE